MFFHISSVRNAGLLDPAHEEFLISRQAQAVEVGCRSFPLFTNAFFLGADLPLKSCLIRTSSSY